MLFSELGLSPNLLLAIEEQGYIQPTPIQIKAIPLILSGVDLLAAAQTGTGKTAAFMLPILEHLKKYANTSVSPAMHPVRALILSPTRELADQIGTNTRTYTKYLPLRSTTVFGGVNIDPQTQELRLGVEILIATPGRLLDHIQQKTIQLNKIEVVVLDEGDRMLDMGFIQDIRKIMVILPKARQTLLFSATLAPDIKQLAAEFMKSPQMIEVARQNATNEQVEQIVYSVDTHKKRHLLTHLIKSCDMRQVIVFCKTKLSADRLARDLKCDGLQAEAIHSDKSQGTRLEMLTAFKEGKLHVLVATDVVARGLDVTELPYVVNFELPNAPEDYVHRIGRTGRAGAKGVAISLISLEETRQHESIRKITKQALTPQTVHGFRPSWLTPPKESEPRSSRLEAAALVAPSEGLSPPLVSRRSRKEKREVPALLLPPLYTPKAID